MTVFMTVFYGISGLWHCIMRNCMWTSMWIFTENNRVSHCWLQLQGRLLLSSYTFVFTIRVLHRWELSLAFFHSGSFGSSSQWFWGLYRVCLCRAQHDFFSFCGEDALYHSFVQTRSLKITAVTSFLSSSQKTEATSLVQGCSSMHLLLYP